MSHSRNNRCIEAARDGAGFRRVVASPEPLRILELATIRTLIDAGTVVVCAGGGGIPVILADGLLRGVEAVIDKDLPPRAWRKTSAPACL